MENRTNQSAQATSYDQDSAKDQMTPNSNGQGGMMDSITGKLSNIQVPDAVKNMQLPQGVKDLGTTVSRSIGSLTTTQKVIGGAALALGATYWAATSKGWMGMGKAAKARTTTTGTKIKRA
ncbi:hypothetical protein [Rufibacter roseus]|uniref:YtxH domain-containing protein n=1 Tax=Rufibacter roseus TaxID=1567108 RepID=A0ABW2DG55_9BACT|nr:hypothetical protein [Rufibacter roseus]